MAAIGIPTIPEDAPSPAPEMRKRMDSATSIGSEGSSNTTAGKDGSAHGGQNFAFLRRQGSSSSFQKQTEITDKLQMEQWLRICDEKDLVGIWECYRESDITGDPACKTLYKWRLSVPQVRMAFMDSQASDQVGASGSSGTDAVRCLLVRPRHPRLRRPPLSHLPSPLVPC